MKKILCFMLVISFVLTATPSLAYASGDGAGAGAAAAPVNTAMIVFDSAEDAASVVTGGVIINFGDVNADGKITSKDSLTMKKYIAGVVSLIDFDAADINCDGSVNTRDLAALKRLIVGDENVIVPSSHASAGAASFDALECAAKITASAAGDLSAKIVTDELRDGFAASDYRYAGIVYKAQSASKRGAVYPDGDGAVKTEYDVISDGEYHAKLIALDECEGWCGDVSAIAFDFVASAAPNDTVWLDSFIMTNDVEELERAAAERLQARVYTSLAVADGSSGDVSDSDTLTIAFNSEDSLGDLRNPNNTTCTFNKYATCLELSVSGNKADPYVYLDLSSYGLSADEYRYVTYVYRSRNSSSYERRGEIFFCAGSVAQPTGGCSYQFTLTQNGNLYAVTIDGAALKNKSGAAYWNGDIHGLRLDYFQDANVGEAVFVKGIVLSKSSAAASAAASLMTGASSVGAMDAKASVDYMFKVYSKDTSGAAYIDDSSGDHVFTFTGGTLDRFTREHLEGRLAGFIEKNVGVAPDVEILDGYDALYDSYAATELSEGYVTYKVQIGDAFCILFRKTVYNMQKVILDHDLGPDCDDAAAVCIVVKAHMKGEINCLAITSCMYTSMSAVAAAVPDYLGCHDIPFSYNNERSATGTNVRCCGTPATQYWNRHGSWPTIYKNTPLLRQIFADNGGKGDIIFITIGPLTTLYCLFNSQGDSVSPMTGRELFAANVKSYIVGGGNFANLNDNEHNFAEDYEATAATVNTITEVPMTFVGANVAGNFLTGDNLPNCPDDWVLKPYYYLQTWEQYYTRQAWDLATVYYAIYGGAGMWQVKSGYRITSWSNGATIMSQPGTSSYIDPIVNESYVKAVFNRTMEPYLN